MRRPLLTRIGTFRGPSFRIRSWRAYLEVQVTLDAETKAVPLFSELDETDGTEFRKPMPRSGRSPLTSGPRTKPIALSKISRRDDNLVLVRSRWGGPFFVGEQKYNAHSLHATVAIVFYASRLSS
jgi:hypothetical protein